MCLLFCVAVCRSSRNSQTQACTPPHPPSPHLSWMPLPSTRPYIKSADTADSWIRRSPSVSQSTGSSSHTPFPNKANPSCPVHPTLATHSPFSSHCPIIHHLLTLIRNSSSIYLSLAYAAYAAIHLISSPSLCFRATPCYVVFYHFYMSLSISVSLYFPLYFIHFLVCRLRATLLFFLAFFLYVCVSSWL